MTAGKGDRHEPSLEVLGRNIEAFNMLHIFHIAHVSKIVISGDVEQYVEQIAPAVKSHPLFPLLQTYRFSRSHRIDTFAPLMKDFAFKDGNPFTGYRFYNSLPANLPLSNMLLSEARDLCWYGQMEDEEYIAADVYWTNQIHPTTLENMKWVSQESPLRIGALLRYNYDNVRDKEQEWLEKYGHYSTIHSALGEVYEKKGNYSKAVEHLEIAVDTVDDFLELNRLASIYYKLDDDRWLATIERVLHREDYGLEHSKANATIAHTLMSEGKFQEALPYAEQGAHSGALWAYTVHLDCLTGLQSWDLAEQIAKHSGNRYRKSTWFDWCAETGRGDLEAAWEAEQQRLARYAPSGDRTIGVQKVIYLIVSEHRQEALKFITEELDKTFTPWNCMHQALLADELGNTALRDQALANMAVYQPKEEARWNPYKYLAITLQRALQEDRSLKMSDIEAIFADRKGLEKWTNSLRYFTANFNWIHAKGEDKTAMLKSSARLPYFGGWPRTLAWARLRGNGIDPIQLDDRKFSMQYTKPAK